MRLAILATHPVQYHAPLYRALVARGVDLHVFFGHRPTAREQGVDFGVAFQWDVDLTGGFSHEFLENRSSRPSTDTFRGVDAPGLRGAIAGRRLDALLVSGWHSQLYWQGVQAARAAAIPVLVRGDSQLATDSRPLKRALKRALYPILLRRFDVCLAVGTRSEEYFRYYGARAIARAPHFVQNDFFATRADALAAERPRLRAELGIEENATVFLFAGKLIERKRPLDLLAALERADDPRLALLFAGDGELRGACEARAASRPGRVAFTGFLNQTEMPRAYAAADVLVLPSDGRETWGLVVNEAMASGLPAIVSDAVGCAPDLVIEGQTGYVTRFGDVEALSDRMVRIAEDASRRREMSANARRLVSAFSVDAAADGVIAGVELALRRRAS